VGLLSRDRFQHRVDSVFDHRALCPAPQVHHNLHNDISRDVIVVLYDQQVFRGSFA
jgi:hypothetical protein